MLVLEWKEGAFIEKVNSRCFCWFPAAILVHQNDTRHGVPIQSSTKVRETFRQITRETDMFLCPCASSRVKRRSFYRKSELQMFLLISSGHIGAPKRYPTWRPNTKLYKGAWNVPANNSRNCGATKTWEKLIILAKLFILAFYNTSFSWLLPLDVFLCRVYCVKVKPIYTVTKEDTEKIDWKTIVK